MGEMPENRQNKRGAACPPYVAEPRFLLIVGYCLDDVRGAHALRVLFKVFADVVLNRFSD